jgi:hypothetical protein
MSESTLELDLHNPQQWAVVLDARLQPFVKSWLTAGKKLTLTCKLQKRTKPQNRRYWGKGILAQITEQAVVNGSLFSAETWHEQFKRQFIGVIPLPNGQLRGMSSKDLTTAEFCEFSDKVEAYAATELSVIFIDLPVKDLR